MYKISIKNLRRNNLLPFAYPASLPRESQRKWGATTCNSHMNRHGPPPWLSFKTSCAWVLEIFVHLVCYYCCSCYFKNILGVPEKNSDTRVIVNCYNVRHCWQSWGANEQVSSERTVYFLVDVLDLKNLFYIASCEYSLKICNLFLQAITGVGN